MKLQKGVLNVPVKIMSKRVSRSQQSTLWHSQNTPLCGFLDQSKYYQNTLILIDPDNISSSHT